MYTPVSLQELDNARQDVESLEKVVNGNENEDVTTRLGETYPTLSKFIKDSEGIVQSSINAVIDGSMITDELVSVGGGETQADKNAEFELDKFDTGITTVPQYVGAVPQTLYDINIDNTTAKTFGAKCDGVTDDTIALQKYLATDITDIIIPNKCLISGTLTSALADRTITTTGYGFIGGTKDLELLRIEGVNTTARVNIDGNNLVSTGIRVLADKAKILGCDISDIYGEDVAAFGIVVDGDVSATIGNCTVNGVDALPDDITTNDKGAARAIYITSTVARTKPVVVMGNTLTDVKGTEGNAIHVICNNGTFPFLDSNAIITSNTIVNCTRRAVKIQASSTQCLNNTHTNTLTIEKLPTATSLYEIVSSNNCIVKGNTADARVGFSGIGAAGQIGTLNTGNVIDNNTIRCGTSGASGLRPAQTGIYVTYNNGIIVQNNPVNGGLACITLDNSINSSVNNNRVSGDKSGASAIVVNANSSNNDISGNKLLWGNRSFLIQNAGKNNYVGNNTVLSGSAGCVVPIAGATGSIYENNTCMGNGTAVYIKDVAAGEGQVFNNHRSIAGTSSSPSVMFTKESPETEQPNINHSRGDISFKSNPIAGGTVGWVCIGSGMWRSFGSVSITP